MTRVSASPDGTPTDEMADYYRDFARGGFGVVITEGTYTDTTHSQGYLNQPGLATDAHVEGWRRVVDGVHAEGVPVIAQLMHAGALSQGNSYDVGTIAPSRVGPLADTPRDEPRRHRLCSWGIRRRGTPCQGCGIRRGRGARRERLPTRPVHHRLHQ